MTTMIVDFNNVAVSKLFSKNVMEKTKYEVHNIDYDVWRYSVFNDIYWYMKKFKNIDEVVLAIDSKSSWRKKYFPRYKAHRQKTKDKFNIDWQEYNDVASDYIEEIRKYLPFKIIWKKYAEGDDVIGAVVLDNKGKSFVIVSSDQDYLQLCRKGVTVYSIQKQDYIKHPNPEMFLQESSLKGQAKDNIFNVITPLDYPDELRKPPFGDKKCEKFLIDGLTKSLDNDIVYKRKYIDDDGKPRLYESTINLAERYKFNRNLMDFSKIPNSVKNSILNEYYNYEYPHPSMIFEFFDKYKWPYYMDNFTNVENNLCNLYQSEKPKEK